MIEMIKDKTQKQFAAITRNKLDTSESFISAFEGIEATGDLKLISDIIEFSEPAELKNTIFKVGKNGPESER